MSSAPTRRRVLSGIAGSTVLLAVGASPVLANAPKLRPFDSRVILSGHSLTDPIPDPLFRLVQAAGGKEAERAVIDKSTLPGSPIEIRWRDRNQYGPDARHDIGNYEVLVMTERVPLAPAMEWHDSRGYALKWYEHALAEGNGGKGADMVLYATWISVTSGPGNVDEWDNTADVTVPFRERLEIEMGRWQELADYVNGNRPAGSPPITVIPGPKLMATVYDAIAAGTAPGLSDMRDLFSDNIHVNVAGGLLMALAHYAVIYGRDPREIPLMRVTPPGWPGPETVAWMKQVVWDVLRAYPDSGFA